MKVVYDNIWHRGPDDWVVVPTNIGWKKDGSNVMGRGLAKQALERCGPALASWYGGVCRTFREWTPAAFYYSDRLIMFPTKPLARHPWQSWREAATVEQVALSLVSLRRAVPVVISIHATVRVPLVGCGNGQLPVETVEPLLHAFLDDPRFLLVKPR